jgi:replicative DNA helicase
MKGSVELNEVYRVIDKDVLEKSFMPEYRNVYKAISAYYLRHRVVPSYEIVEALLDDEGDSSDEVLMIQVVSCEEDEIGYYIDKLRQRYNRFLIKKLDLKIEDESIEDINKLIRELGLETEKIYRESVYSEGNISDSVGDRVSSYNETKNSPESACGVLTGYRELDEYTWGIKPSELFVIGGASSSGKSLLMMNMAINGWLGSNNPKNNTHDSKDGKNILFFSLEMSKEQMEMRIDSNVACIPHTSLERGRLSAPQRSAWERCLEFQEGYDKKFYIVDMPRGSTVAQLEAKYESIVGIFKPDIIFIDYLQLMAPRSNATGTDWLDIGRVSEEMHEFCRNVKLPVVTAAQRKASGRKSGAKKEGKDHLDLEDLGRSKMIGDNANIVALIASREDEHLREDMEIHIVKNRNGPKGSFSLHKKFDLMAIEQFPDDWTGNIGDENEF